MKLFSKNTLLFVVIMALVGMFPQTAHAFSATAQQIQGDVLVHKVGTDPDAWEAIKTDTPLSSGDSIKTRKGGCVLAYSDQATFVMQENTSLMVEEKAESQNIELSIGKILGKVNHPKVTKPFEISTPAAVAAVRGTEVDFGFNDDGQMTVDLHNGKIQVLNDQAQMSLGLEGKKQIKVKFDKETNTISVQNECGSDGAVTFSALGSDFSLKPCEEHTVDLTTASGPSNTLDTDTDDPGKKSNDPNENNSPNDNNDPNQGREPISPTS